MTSVRATTTSTSLDLFLLALIEDGIATAYAMRERAALSVGATLPALRRLEHQGLVERGKAEARNKTAFKLTASGRRVLNSGLAEILAEFQANMPGEIESVLRVAALTAARGRRADARRLLRLAAADRRGRVVSRSGESGEQKPPADVASLYRWMLAECDSAQQKAESKALSSLLARKR